MADRSVRAGPLVRDHGALRNRPAVVRGVQPRSRGGQRPDAEQGMARLLPVLLAHFSLLAIPAHPGRPRHAGHRPGARTAGEAVVGHPEVVRVATDPLGQPRYGAAVAAVAGRRRRLRVRHRHPQRPAPLHLPRLLLHPALLRGLGVHRRVRRACGLPAAQGTAGRTGTIRGACGGYRGSGRAGLATPRGADHLPPGCPGHGGARVGRAAGRHGGAEHRRMVAADRPAGPARPGPGFGPERVPDQQDRRLGRHPAQRRRSRVAADRTRPGTSGRPDVRAAPGHDAARVGPAHRLRGGLVDPRPAVGRGPAHRSGRTRRARGEHPRVLVESVQRGGSFSSAVLSDHQVRDSRSLLAVRVNGATLSADHGYPARAIIAGAPGVHNTKWVTRLTFGEPA